jgi:hypothetical protein
MSSIGSSTASPAAITGGQEEEVTREQHDHDRESLAAIRQIAAEPPAIVRRVLRQIDRLAPRGCTDDDWWVWGELKLSYPDAVDYRYARWQISLMWKRVHQMRCRCDHVGEGGPMRALGKRRAVALKSLASFLSRRPKDVLAIDFDDYYEGTLVLTGLKGKECFTVPSKMRDALDRWIRVRGEAAGRLFDYPMRMGHRESCFSERGFVVAALPDNGEFPGCRLELEERVERLAAGASDSARRCVAEGIASCGDWSERLCATMEGLCGQPLAAMPALTKQQRYRARRALEACLANIDSPEKE